MTTAKLMLAASLAALLYALLFSCDLSIVPCDLDEAPLEPKLRWECEA